MAHLERRLPDPKELFSLLQFSLPTLNRREARLERAADVEDLRAIAKRRTPTPAFDYVDGAAGNEATARRAREAFDAVELVPKVLSPTPNISPVSYTHLRAHETKANLVCRLLLEKKKDDSV